MVSIRKKIQGSKNNRDTGPREGESLTSARAEMFNGAGIKKQKDTCFNKSWEEQSKWTTQGMIQENNFDR